MTTTTVVRIAVCLLGMTAGSWVFGRPRRLSRTRNRPDGTVTLVIPARDEELSIGRLLHDLRDRDPDVEVIVVDDHSTDATRSIVAEHTDVILLDAPDLPEGWTGKCWACHQGAEAARGATLAFVDADGRLEPGALRDVLGQHRRTGGLVSVQPWHAVDRPYERLSALFNVVALMGAGAGSARPCTAFGPVMVTDAAGYRAVGGHRAVRDQVVEDLALARLYCNAGLPTAVVSCDPRITYRMYPAGVRQLVDGWTKNFAIGAGAVPKRRLAAVVAWTAALGTGCIALLDGVLGRQPLSAGVVLYVAVVVQVAAMFRRCGRFGLWDALLLPVHLVLFVTLFSRSVWRTMFRRRVTWRGREIRVAPIVGVREQGRG